MHAAGSFAEERMIIGVLQVELLIGDAASLKDKRRVLMSIKDRLHRDFNVAVAEIDRQDAHQIAVLGIAAVGNEGGHVQGVMDKILDQLRANRRVVLNDQQTELFSGR